MGSGIIRGPVSKLLWYTGLENAEFTVSQPREEREKKMRGNQVLLVVSFGTANEQARKEEIGGVEAALRRRCPELPFVRAYTSPTIRKILARQGILVPSLEEALQQQADLGSEQVCLLPTHMVPGYEYDAIREAANRFRPQFQELRLAPPLMGDTTMLRALAEVLMERWPRSTGQAVLLIGHGTTHPGNLVYPALQGMFHLAGREDLFVGTVEGWPSPAALMPALRGREVERIQMVPLLLTAGTHVREDIAGSGPASWKSQLEAAGFTVRWALEGLGRMPQVQNLYVRRLEEIL